MNARAAIAVAWLLALPALAQVPRPSPGEAPQQLILRFASSDVEAAFSPRSRVARLERESGIALEYVRGMATGLRVARLAPGADADQAAARLRARSDVVSAQANRWVVPTLNAARAYEDGTKRHLRSALTPNDTYVFDQYYLTNDPASISAFAAWNVTTGSPSTVVAVVDTGVLPHPDLAGRILPGYDFIADLPTANDGDGRDANATDPGDWVSAQDQFLSDFAGCPKTDSTWIGTAVAGVVAANANNDAHVAGIDWAAKILPVRVWGKCGAFYSDIFDGIAWAGGLSVPGVPDNPTPAHVMTLTLGDTLPCDSETLALFDRVLKAGVTRAIAVASGQGIGGGVSFPANCANALGIGVTSSDGGKTSYGGYGAGLLLSAPGGEFSGQGEFFAVLQNNGATVPSAYITQDYAGTSFPPAMVSGVISLMLGVAPHLTPGQVRSLLQSSAKPFPAGSNCSTASCGAGILNALGAVTAALSTPPTLVPVVEYYNVALDHYFTTAKAEEIAALDANLFPGWVRTGQAFNAYPFPPFNTSPVCRFYLPPGEGDSHFYSALPTECAVTHALKPEFVLESSYEFYIATPDLATGTCPAGTMPVYRLWNHRPDTNHRFTTSLAIRDQMLALGYIAEGAGIGVTMCAPV